jgi:hypothetical protein
MPKPESAPAPDPAADRLWNGILDVFRSHGWHHETVPGMAVVESGFEAHHGRVFLHVQAYAPLRAVSVVSLSPARIGVPAVRAKAAELLLRANERLNLGAFEMRWDAGEVLFRIGNVFPGGQVDAGVLTWMVETAVVEMDRLLPALGVLSRADAGDVGPLDMEAWLEREDWIPDVSGPGADGEK